MRDEPVHKPKGVVFGPTIVYDGERCVMCTRCIRFMDEVAKDPVLDMRERGNLNEIIVAPGRQLDGHYTFMTEHVCPVGALTTKDFRFKARVWFLRTAPSVCQGCATGCNAHLDYDPRYNKAYRYRPRDNEQVNKYWMCDEGMLTYKRGARGARRSRPSVGRARRSRRRQALDAVKSALRRACRRSRSRSSLGAQHSLEDNWALRELGAVLIGATQLLLRRARPTATRTTILIHRDKNPNTRGVQQLAPGRAAVRKLWSTTSRRARSRTSSRSAASAPAIDVDAARAAPRLVTIAAHDGPLDRRRRAWFSPRRRGPSTRART